MQNIEEIFSIDNLLKVYEDYILLSFATGIDNLSQRAFYQKRHEEVSIISRKVLNGTYKFTNYKLALISKGRGKNPREISIPTIRDRITLRAICDFLLVELSHLVSFELPQDTIRSVKADFFSSNYSMFMKLDIENFYPSVNHKKLIDILNDTIQNKLIINLIQLAIKNPTVIKSSKSDLSNNKGVPQGLSISNILATFYLISMDKNISLNSNIQYYRYVDDILIFSKENNLLESFEYIKNSFNSIDLVIHNPNNTTGDKSKIGNIATDYFDYLGYKFQGQKVTVRQASIEKLKESLVSIFTSYKYSKIKNKEFLLWRLNIRITGCIFESKSKGWLFFFSEIEDEPLLHQLDFYVEKLVRRFNVIIEPKKFVRSFFEIKHNKYHSKYIPNFDSYTIDEMKEVLVKYFKKDITKMSEEEIKYNFRKKIQRQAKELLADLQAFGGYSQ